MVAELPFPYGIGACLNCRHLFLSTPTSRECPLCGRTPTILQPLQGPTPAVMEAGPLASDVFCPPGAWGEGEGPAAAEGEPAGEGGYVLPIELDGVCPRCGLDLLVTLGEDGMTISRLGRPAAAGESSDGEEQLSPGDSPPQGEEGAAEPEEPTHAEGPASEPVSGDPSVKDDPAAPPSDDTPPGV